MWLIYAILTVVFYVGMDFCVKKAAGKIDDFWGTVLINAVSMTPALLVIAWMKLSGREIMVTREGLIYSILAGVSIGIGTITLLKMFATGVNLSLGSPLVRVGIVIGTFVVGMIVLREQVSVKQTIGMVLALIGLFVMVSR